MKRDKPCSFSPLEVVLVLKKCIHLTKNIVCFLIIFSYQLLNLFTRGQGRLKN